MHDYDKTSKWLIQHHADSILRLAGVPDIAAWKPLQAELVMARRFPDGLIEVRHQGEPKPETYIIEVATYPVARIAEQILDDTAAFRLVRRSLPEVVVLFLRPKGKIEAAGSAERRSRRGFTSWNVGWRAIRLWEVPAADLLAAGDVGLIPWVPLAKFDGPPEPIFRECRDRIRRDAPEDEQEPMMVIAHFLAGLKYNDVGLFQILGGRQIMIESKSPFVQEMWAQIRRDAARRVLGRILRRRFGAEAEPIIEGLDLVEDGEKLEDLVELAAICADLESFRKQISP